MAQAQRPYTKLITAAIFILLEIAALTLLGKSAPLQDIWINRASHRVMGALWGSGETLRNHFSLEKQNLVLAEENARLNNELREYKLRDAENLENAASLTGADGGFLYTPATIVKISRNTAHNYIILNKGSEDGIRPHSGIITPQGVVGIVDAVGRHHSYGLTLMNTNISVSSRVGDTGIVGPLVWDGQDSNGAYLKDIPLHYTVSPGDTIFTSGFSIIFPPDIPVGIAGTSKIANGSTQQVNVTLFQDFSSLRYVTVAENLDRAEIFALEEQKKEEEDR